MARRAIRTQPRDRPKAATVKTQNKTGRNRAGFPTTSHKKRKEKIRSNPENPITLCRRRKF